jgi:ABC-type glutathione transport system ATPase component
MNNRCNVRETDCDRVYLLEKGRIVKSGSYEEVVLEKLGA